MDKLLPCPIGAYADKWNTQQAEYVRVLRKRADDAEAREREAYERAAKVAANEIANYSGNAACALHVANKLKALSDSIRKESDNG